MRDEEIEQTVVVVVAKGRPGGPSRVGDAGLRGHISERAVTVVVEQMVGSVAGDIEVCPAVVVVVAGRHTHPPAGITDARFFGDIGEGAITIVAPQFAASAVRVCGRGDRWRVNKIDIQPAIVVVIEEGHASTHRFKDVSSSREPRHG